MITPAPREKLSLTLNDREPVRPIVSILVSTAKSRPFQFGSQVLRISHRNDLAQTEGEAVVDRYDQEAGRQPRAESGLAAIVGTQLGVPGPSW